MLRPVFCALVWLPAIGCFDDGTGGGGQACPVGSEGCPCTSGDSCDEGLACRSGRCVSLGGESDGANPDTYGGSGDGDGTGSDSTGGTGGGSTGGQMSTTGGIGETSAGTSAETSGGASAGTTSGGGVSTGGPHDTTTGDPGGSTTASSTSGPSMTTGMSGGTSGGMSGGTSGDTTGGGTPTEDPIYPMPGAQGCPGDTALLDPGTKYCGAPCDAQDECPDAATGWADAYCAYNPDSSAADCMSDAHCPAGESCVDNAGGTRSCLGPATHCALFCFVDVQNCPVQMICDPIDGNDGFCMYP